MGDSVCDVVGGGDHDPRWGARGIAGFRRTSERHTPDTEPHRHLSAEPGKASMPDPVPDRFALAEPNAVTIADPKPDRLRDSEPVRDAESIAQRDGQPDGVAYGQSDVVRVPFAEPHGVR